MCLCIHVHTHTHTLTTINIRIEAEWDNQNRDICINKLILGDRHEPMRRERERERMDR